VCGVFATKALRCPDTIFRPELLDLPLLAGNDTYRYDPTIVTHNFLGLTLVVGGCRDSELSDCFSRVPLQRELPCLAFFGLQCFISLTTRESFVSACMCEY